MTVRLIVPEAAPLAVVTVAVIVTVPAETPLTTPVELTVAVPVALDDHVARFVISSVLPSEKLAVAVNCRVEPVVTWVLVAVTEIGLVVCRPTVRTITLPVPLTPPWEAVTVVVPTPAAVTSPEVFTVAVPEAPVVHVAE